MDIFTAPTLNTLPARSPIVSRPIAPPFITEYLNSGDGYTRVRMSDGTVQTLQGTRADRNNNPGNLTGTLAGAQRRGAIGIDHGGNYVFPSADAGRKAMAEMVLNENANKSIGDMIEFYAPKPKRDPETGELKPVANDINNTNRFYPGLIAGQGFNLQDRVGSLDPAQQQALLGAMMGVEGYSGAPAAQLASAAPVAPAASPAPPAVNPMMLRAGSQNRGPAVTSPTATPMDFAGAAQNRIANAPDLPPPSNPMAFAAVAQDRINATPTPQPEPVTRPRMAVGAARAETKELGLLADPQVASTVAQTTTNAAAQVANSPEEPKPLTKEERKKWSPESLGLIAFGLSLLGGSDMDTAISAGMNIYESLESRKDRKERQKAIDAFIDKQDPETQELMRLAGPDTKTVVDIALAKEGQQAAAQEVEAFAQNRAKMVNELMTIDPSLTPEQLAVLDYDTLSKQYSDKLFESRGVNKADYDDREWTAAETAYQMKLGADTIVEMLGPDKSINNLDLGDRKRFAAAKDAIKIAYITYKSGAAFSPAEEEMYDGILNWQNAKFDNKEANADALMRLEKLMQMLARRSNGAYTELLTGPEINLGVNFGALNPQQTIDAGGITFTVEGM